MSGLSFKKRKKIVDTLLVHIRLPRGDPGSLQELESVFYVYCALVRSNSLPLQELESVFCVYCAFVRSNSLYLASVVGPYLVVLLPCFEGSDEEMYRASMMPRYLMEQILPLRKE